MLLKIRFWYDYWQKITIPKNISTPHMYEAIPKVYPFPHALTKLKTQKYINTLHTLITLQDPRVISRIQASIHPTLEVGSKIGEGE